MVSVVQEGADKQNTFRGVYGMTFSEALEKVAREGVSFLKQDRPAKAKEIYRAMTRRRSEMRELRRRYGTRAKEVAARVASRHAPPGKQHRGKPWKYPV